MKTLCLFALLIAPITGFGQVNLFERPLREGTAPVRVYGTDAGLGKGFKLGFRTLFSPKRVKDEWPVYGYSISGIKDELCSNQSLEHEKFTVEMAALVRPRQDRPDAYIGVPLRRSGEGEITEKIEDVCAWIRRPNLERGLRMYDAVDLPNGTWVRISEGLPRGAIPLLRGASRIEDVSELDYSMIWMFSEGGEPNSPNFKLPWENSDPGLARGQQGVVWKYEPNASTSASDFYLAKAGGSSHDVGDSHDAGDRIEIWSPWKGIFRADSREDFTSGNYSIWYSPPEGGQFWHSVDDWFLVTDRPLPHAGAADIRVDPFK